MTFTVFFFALCHAAFVFVVGAFSQRIGITTLAFIATLFVAVFVGDQRYAGEDFIFTVMSYPLTLSCLYRMERLGRLNEGTPSVLYGLARMFTGLHVLVGILFLVGATVKSFGQASMKSSEVLLAAGLYSAYYIYVTFFLKNDSSAKDALVSLGNLFTEHPIMTGTAIIWTDFCVGVMIFEGIKSGWLEGRLSNPVMEFWLLPLGWLIPIGLLFGGNKLLRWMFATKT